MPKCPRCEKSLELVDLGLHLMESHLWTFEEALDWMRDLEERRAA